MSTSVGTRVVFTLSRGSEGWAEQEPGNRSQRPWKVLTIGRGVTQGLPLKLEAGRGAAEEGGWEGVELGGHNGSKPVVLNMWGVTHFTGVADQIFMIHNGGKISYEVATK